MTAKEKRHSHNLTLLSIILCINNYKISYRLKCLVSCCPGLEVHTCLMMIIGSQAVIQNCRFQQNNLVFGITDLDPSEGMIFAPFCTFLSYIFYRSDTVYSHIKYHCTQL